MSEQEKKDLSGRMIDCIRAAQLRLYHIKAKLGETVVIADSEGNPVVVSAEEALRVAERNLTEEERNRLQLYL